jgi:hypothetical protein
MPHPLSVRFRTEATLDRLKAEAAARSRSTSALAEELIDEGLRMRRHRLIVFREGPAGRRAGVIGGPDVWEVISGLIGGDVEPSERVTRAEQVFGWRRELVDAALGYYAEYPDEIDSQIEFNRRAADEAEELWHRQSELLSR